MKPRWTIVAYFLLVVSLYKCEADSNQHPDDHHDDHGDHDDHDHSNHKGTENNPGNKKKDSKTEMIEEEKQHFIKLLFQKYGHDGRIEFEGFEHLLESLGLAQVKIEDHDIHDHHTGTGFRKLHKSHEHFKNGTKKTSKKRKQRMKWKKELFAAISQAIEPLEFPHETATKQHRLRHHGKNKGKKGHEERVKEDVPVKETVPDEGDHFLDFLIPFLNETGSAKTEKETGSAKTEKETSSAKTEKETGSAKTEKETGSAKTEIPLTENIGMKEDISLNDTVLTKDRIPLNEDTRSKRSVGKEPTQCMTPSQLFMAYQLKYENGLTEEEFLSVCPAMVYQLDIHVCNKNLQRTKDCFHEKEHLYRYHPQEKEGAHDHEHGEDTASTGSKRKKHGHGHGHGHGVQAEPTWELHELPAHIWGFAFLSVTIISLVGLGGVAVVPIMQKVFYNHLIQFLVALAVGSLTGDALLHLLPHSILSVETGHDTSDEAAEAAEKDGVYKGLVALGGIYFFFIAERIMAILSMKKKQRKTKRRRSIRESVVGQKLSDYGENGMGKSCEDIVMVLNPNKAEMQDALAVVIDEHRRASAKSLTLEVPNHQGSHHGSQQSLKNHVDHVDSDNEDGPKKGHGHSHGDGKPPTSIAAVAWMVVLGDGLHNFSDGLAIGAAFANSLTGGLSTSIAVFCHELPHELGDFAVLLKAGMTARQALFYNLLSSVLAFLGMVIGVCVGNISSASFWIFAMTAGMFLYIALVDMLPEISTVETKPGESSVCHLFLHLCGISVGLGIMLVIALFEDSIRIDFANPFSTDVVNITTTMAP